MLFVQDDTFNNNKNNNKINNVPDYFPPNVCHDIIPEEENNNNKIKNFRAVKDYHEDEDEDFYFLGQHLNTPGLLDDEYPDYYDSNFEIANRAFYATINKFTRQSCPESSRRKSSYSFLENWHLHSIYSKSQQTLLGITPVRPSVLLSGDDFMFTPPFVPPENGDQLEFDWEESDESEFYSLSPCPESNQAGQFAPLSDSNDVQNSLMLSASPPPTPPQSHPSDAPYLTEKEDKMTNYYDSFNESALLNENSWIENQRRPRSLSGFEVNETMGTNHNLISDNVHHISLYDTNDNHVIDMSEDLLTSYQSNDQQFTSSSSSSSSSSEGENEIEQDFQDYDDEEDEDDDDEYDDFEYTDEAYDDDDDYDDNNDDIDYNKRRSGELSTFNFEHLYEPPSIENEIIYKEPGEAPMTRSSSFLSHKSAEMPHMTPSIMSYQSLADILSSPPLSPPPLSSPSISPMAKHYGTIERQTNGNTLIFQPIHYDRGVVQVVKSTMAAILDLSDAYASHYDEEMAITSVQSTPPESGSTSNSFWAYSFTYLLYIWQLLVLCSESVIVNIRKHIIPHRQ
jgi:hypothetical protein